MSVPLQTVPGDEEGGNESSMDDSVSQAKHEAAEIIADARRQAEAIIAEARSSQSTAAPSPLAALGDNAEEIIGQVRKLIKKQRELQDERQGMLTEIEELKAERDELVQRLTDAVVRMEELAALAQHEERTPTPAPSPPPQVSQAPPPPPPAPPVTNDYTDRVEEPEDTSLAARLGKVDREEKTSLAARLEQAEREEREQAQRDSNGDSPPVNETFTDDDDIAESRNYVVGSDGRSFYSRHSAKLPRLEGDGGRSVLSAVGGMRPDTEPKGRKGRRRKKG